MASGEDWSRVEVEDCAADCLQMLTLKLNGATFNKTERIRALIGHLGGRSKASVEDKFRNISALFPLPDVDLNVAFEQA